jgi:hypothetical protein
MAMLPSGFIVSTTGVYTNYPTEKIGGVAAKITSATTVTAGQPLTSVLPLSSILPTSIMSTRRNRVIQATGVSSSYNATTALAATGTFAYDQDAFLIMGYSGTINGSANTSIKMTGGDGHRLRRSLRLNDMGYGFGTAFRAGYFSFTGVANQRTNWSTNPSALSNTFKSTTNNAVNADDQAQYVTWRSIPGELTYMQGSVTPKQDDYKAVTG